LRPNRIELRFGCSPKLPTSLKQALYACTLLFLAATAVNASESPAYFHYSGHARNIYTQIFSFQLEDARVSLKSLKSREPGNLAAIHLDNYLDFFQLYVSEDKALYQRLKKNEDARLKLLQLGDETSPYYYYGQADILLQWAFLKLRFGEYLPAFISIGKAYKLLQRNQQKYPRFLPNLKNLGILHAMVGAIPDNYRWGARVLGGLRGSIRQGKAELETVISKTSNQEFPFREEALLLYTYVLLNFSNEPDKAWMTVSNAGLNPKSNLLHCFLLASVAMQCKRNDDALELLENKPTHQSLLPFPYLDFLHGNAKLRKLDPGASEQFLRFLKNFKGENGIKETYQKLSWAALLRNDIPEYRQFKALAVHQGQAATGPDKNALIEAQNPRLPSLSLLKARLLFDGGYLAKALETMLKVNARDFKEVPEQIEYHYRTGRIHHSLGNMAAALSAYRTAIDLGQNLPLYFACNAALQTGLIYEKQKNLPLARQFFRLCLSLDPSDYRSSLHQSAKAGLNRLDGL
jgi:hypothetical protein